MTNRVTRNRLAQSLSVIGEAGLEGFPYNSAVNAFVDDSYESGKGRWTIRPSPKFTSDEFRHLMSYAARAKLIEAGDDTQKVINSELGLDPWHLTLTLKGWEYIELHDQPIIHRWATNIRDNVPTVLISVVTSLLAGWAAFVWGAPK